MKKKLRIAVAGAALAAASLFLVPADSQAQVRVEGRFRLPHGDIAIGVGDPYYGGGYYYGSPAYPVGSYVPYGYRVIERPRFGYGFASPAFACRAHRVYHSHWVPVRRVRSRWVVVERPVVVVERRYERRYEDDYYTGRRYDDRRYRREPVYGEDPYYDFNREYWDRSYGPGPRQHVHSDSCGHDY
jgi:hypothetical protein